MRTQGWILVLLGILGLGLMITPCSLNAQAVSATVLGTVTDTSGAVVPQAKVAITETKTGFTRTAQTNDSGYYVIADVPPGSYDVAAEKQGFKKTVRNAVDVVVNSTVRVDLSLPPGTVAETVTVTGEAPILQTDRADIGRKIETRQVVDLPLGFNRNFQNLLNLVPGTVRAHREHSEFFNPQDSLSTEVNGQSRLFDDLKLEGVDNNHRTGLLQVYIPPAEAIQAVDVTTSNYSAEFGRAGGAVTNVSLKSGTNAFHGAAYEFNRISALAARSFFNRPPLFKPRITYNYYGGNAGGPIIKNKLFFFGDILRVDDSRGKFSRVTVPIDAFRSGDFRTAGVNIYDPSTGNANGSGRAQFSASSNSASSAYNPACASGTCLNVIPVSRFSSIAQKILALVPHANTNLSALSSNYQAVTRFLKNTTAFDMKFDFNRTDNDRLAFRFSRSVENIDDEPIFGLAGGPNNGGFNAKGVQHTQSGALNDTHVFSSTLISETRIGISHYRNIARQTDFGSKASDAIGIKGANVNDFTSGLVAIRILGVNNDDPLVGYSPSLPWDRGETNINLVNNWTKTYRNHTFKWGADIRRIRDDLVQAQQFNPRGRFDFGTGTTAIPGSKTNLANNFAAFLIDTPTDVGRDIALTSRSWRETELFTFGQDKWQATPKLTLDMGLRWEFYFPPSPHRAGGFSNYDPVNNVLVIAGVGGNPKNLGRENSLTYFAPRLGVAYRLTEKTVFRGGFGMSYEPFPNNQYAWNFPVQQNNEYPQPNSFGFATLDGKLGSPQVNMASGLPAPNVVAIPSNGLLSPKSTDEYNVIDKKFRQPYVEAWNLAVQRALPSNFVLEVAYVGNHGVLVPTTYALNAAIAPGICQFAAGTGGCAPTDPPTKLMTDTCYVRPLCRQLGRKGNTNFMFKRTTSNYNALQVKLDHKWAGGFLLTTAYTYSKALAFRSDQGSDGGSLDNYLDLQRNYSITSQDRRHTFVQSYVYELPFGKGKPFAPSGWASWVLGGWQVSGILTYMTGRPLHFTSDGKSLNAPGTTQTPRQIAPFHRLGGIDNNLWFDTSAFCPIGVTSPPTGCPVVGNGVLGTMKRYAFAGPSLFNLDAGLFRRFSVSERVGLEVRAEAFSLTNTAHFDQPNLSATSNDFGHVRGLISSTDGGSRTIQLGGKITF